MKGPKRSIGICFGKMTTQHEGIGDYGTLFGEHLARRAPELAERHGIRLHMRLPAKLHGMFGDEVSYLPQWTIQRHIALSFGSFDLWHILHQHNPFRPPWGVRRGLATVLDLNQLYGSDESFTRKSTRRLQRIAAWADAFVAISAHTRKDLVAFLKDDTPVRVIHIGVRDLHAVKPERPAGLSAAAEQAGFYFHISRMAVLKNVGALLRLMALMAEQGSPGHLVLAGPRSGDSERVLAEVQAAGLKNVSLLFDVSTAEKAWLFQHCRAFMFPSLAEGFGLPPIEAMQFGKPVFLSALTSLPEVGGLQADYWPDFDPAAMLAVLREGMARYDHDPSGRAAALQEWAGRFTWPVCIDHHVELYLEQLKVAR
jgi:glycosyltransferase involved in cell wall biosynthesis